MKHFENFVVVCEILNKFHKLRQDSLLSILGYSSSEFKPLEKDFYLFDFKIEIDSRVFVNIRFSEDQSLGSGKFIVTHQNSRRVLISFFGKLDLNQLKGFIRSAIEVRKRGIENENKFKADVDFIIKRNYLLGLTDIRKSDDGADIDGIDFFLIYKKKAIPIQITSSWGTFFSKVRKEVLHPHVPCLVYIHGKYHSGILADKLYKICEEYLQDKVLNL